MVDVSSKTASKRIAVAGATVLLGPSAFAALASGQNAKGNVLATARLAGIMAAKRTADLIPLCHPLGLDHVTVELTERPEAHALDIVASATCTGATGVEMEALSAASVAALTVYDMCKAACVERPSTRSLSQGWIHVELLNRRVSRARAQEQRHRHLRRAAALQERRQERRVARRRRGQVAHRAT